MKIAGAPAGTRRAVLASLEIHPRSEHLALRDAREEPMALSLLEMSDR
jgi:hypothetical protein